MGVPETGARPLHGLCHPSCGHLNSLHGAMAQHVGPLDMHVNTRWLTARGLTTVQGGGTVFDTREDCGWRTTREQRDSTSENSKAEPVNEGDRH